MGQASNAPSGRFPELRSPGALQNHARPKLGPAGASVPSVVACLFPMRSVRAWQGRVRLVGGPTVAGQACRLD